MPVVSLVLPPPSAGDGVHPAREHSAAHHPKRLQRKPCFRVRGRSGNLVSLIPPSRQRVGRSPQASHDSIHTITTCAFPRINPASTLSKHEHPTFSNRQRHTRGHTENPPANAIQLTQHNKRGSQRALRTTLRNLGVKQLRRSSIRRYTQLILLQAENGSKHSLCEGHPVGVSPPRFTVITPHPRQVTAQTLTIIRGP